jgi:AcrR family transcriptional regulator
LEEAVVSAVEAASRRASSDGVSNSDRGSAEPGSKRMRADARRNRDALLDAAGAAFGEHGVEASLEDIARRAGVGIGTLYRHFPTREALVEAAYRHGVEQLCDVADDLLASVAPDVALEQWMLRFVGYVATKRGLAATLKATADSHTELFKYVHDRIRGAFGDLISHAAAAKTIRSDVNVDDMVRALGGICMVSDPPVDEQQSRRLVALLMDGLRFGATHRAGS